MKIAEAVKVKEESPDLIALSDILDTYERYRIDSLNWKGYDYKPDVNFSVAYGNNEIFLKFRVRESCFKAEMTESNQNVYEDSCVEFFVSPASDGIYYNLEFNGIGTCLMGCGTGRSGRERVDAGLISLIRRFASSGNNPVGEISGDIFWTLTVALPFSVFCKHHVEDVGGRTFSVNFYKCGDKLSKPHYLTWNPVVTDRPDFHRPQFFGELKFI